MKGIPIKFRAKDIMTGKYVYGEYFTMFNPYLHFVDDEENHFNVEVDPDTVAQLIGYDADRNEVYEGDKLYYYRCFGVSGDYIRQKKIPKAGVCTVIDAHYLDGLPYVGLNDSWDYAFLLKK